MNKEKVDIFDIIQTGEFNLYVGVHGIAPSKLSRKLNIILRDNDGNHYNLNKMVCKYTEYPYTTKNLIMVRGRGLIRDEHMIKHTIQMFYEKLLQSRGMTTRTAKFSKEGLLNRIMEV